MAVRNRNSMQQYRHHHIFVMLRACRTYPSIHCTMDTSRYPAACTTLCYPVRRCTSHPSGLMFHARCVHSWNSLGTKKVGFGTISPRASRTRIVRCWHPLGRRAIELGRPPQGGVVHTVGYGTPPAGFCLCLVRPMLRSTLTAVVSFLFPFKARLPSQKNC